MCHGIPFRGPREKHATSRYHNLARLDSELWTLASLRNEPCLGAVRVPERRVWGVIMTGFSAAAGTTGVGTPARKNGSRRNNRRMRIEDFNESLTQKILVTDGAMGSLL